VVFLTSQPFRIQRFEAETGRPLLQDAGFKSGLSGQVVHVSDELLILHLEGKYLEAYDLGTGGLRWKAMLERTSTRGLELGPEGLVFLGTQRVGGGGDERLFMMTISLKSGKILRRKDTPELGDPRFMLVDGERAYVVTREPDKTISVRGVQLADFSVLWNRPLGGKDATTLLSPLLAKDRALVGVFQEDAQAKYAYGTWLLDKEGRVVQNISSAFTFDRPPVFGLTHNRLVYSVENKVVVYR
jgi:hypothetical protein